MQTSQTKTKHQARPGYRDRKCEKDECEKDEGKPPTAAFQKSAGKNEFVFQSTLLKTKFYKGKMIQKSASRYFDS
ncbi:hypothetical protein [Undibacterium sp. Ren11W]|uniref:hypothetical protein n=1 Tax=Undibacterium sp. Ren11W TaxID=3413045 RepID=UPI003BF015A2